MARRALDGAGLIAIIAVVTLVVGALGSDSWADERALAGSRVIGGGSDVGRSYESPQVPQAQARPRLACGAASFSLGARRGVVDFHIRCSGAGAEGTNRVFVARFSNSNPGLRSDVQAVTRHPEMAEYTSGSERGKCRVNRGIVLCVAPRADGVKLSGQLSVPPESECAKTIGAYVVLPPRCAEACNLEFAVEYLFRGRPKGCSVQ